MASYVLRRLSSIGSDFNHHRAGSNNNIDMKFMPPLSTLALTMMILMTAIGKDVDGGGMSRNGFLAL
jgi:hypothetical protein